MVLSKEHVRSLCIAIIATLIVLLVIQPLFDVCWRLISWWGQVLWSGWTDSVYREAALNAKQAPATILLLFFLFLGFGGGCGILVGVAAALVRKRLFKRAAAADAQEEKRSRWLRQEIAVFLLLGLGVCFSFGLVAVQRYAVLQLTVSFDQRLAVLAPEISDQKCKELRASWASMTNRRDFRLIVWEMEGLARQHDVELPKLLLE